MDNNVATIAWALVKVKKTTKSVSHKILSECYDPQTDRVSWRLSSDLTGATEENGKYLVDTKMGCVYVCRKGAEDVTRMIRDTLKSLEESFDIEVVPMKDWIATK